MSPAPTRRGQPSADAEPRRRGRRSKPAGRPPFGAACLVVLLMAVLAAPLILTGLGRAPEKDYKASGYTSLVNDLIARRGWLSLSYDANGAPRIHPSPDAPRNHRAFLDFVRYSYLRSDMRIADESVWDFDREGVRVVGVDRDAHRIASPFEEFSAWQGDILFRGSGSRTPTIVDQAGNAYALSIAKAAGPAEGASQSISLFQTRPADKRLMAARYVFTIGDQEVAAAFVVGDQVILRARASGVQVKLGDQVLSPEEGRPALAAWREGQSLAFLQGGRAALYSLSSNALAVSSFQGGRLRTRFSGLESLSVGVEGAMGRRARAGHVMTTLDPGLQAAAQKALDLEAERLRDGGRAFPAGVTVMDALSGEILALATYPSQRSQLDPIARRSVSTSPLMERNQNFALLPIGSVAKAPIAVAILQARPELATLRVTPATKSFRTVVGVDLGGDFDDHVSGEGDGLVGYERFLEKSSNKYTAVLMMLALSEDAMTLDKVCEPYVIQGRRLQNAPALAILDGARAGPHGLRPRMQNSGLIPWGHELGQLFRIRTGATAADRSLNADVGVWGPLARTRGSDFVGVSPELQNLGFNDLSNLTTDYIMTGWGGSRSRWTTVQVAEVYSRIVTRRPVRAHLVNAPVDGRAAQAPVSSAPIIQDSAWRPTLAGLRAVALTGTGQRLAPTAPRPPEGDVRIFAKTGTPAVERYVGLTTQSQALMTFWEQGCGLVYGRKGEIRLALDPSAANQKELLGALAMHGGACASPGPQQKLVAAEIVRLNALLARGRLQPSPDARAGAPVTRVPPNPVMVSGAGHVLGLVIAVYPDASTPDDQPSRALAFGINLQNRRENQRTPAVDVARTLLCDATVRGWLSGGGGVLPQGSGCPK